jgi:hypothetical protein
MKTRSLVLLALCMPAALVAQQPAADSANPITQAFRGRIMTLHRNLAQAFDSIPADKFGYKPTPAQQTVGYIAQHLANDNYLFCNTFGEMKFTRPAKDTETADSVKAQWPKDTLVAQLKQSFDFCQRAFGQLSDASIGAQTSMTFRGQTRNVTRASMVLGHALDLGDHYSQIANYMRLNGMLPPTALPRPERR